MLSEFCADARIGKAKAELRRSLFNISILTSLGEGDSGEVAGGQYRSEGDRWCEGVTREGIGSTPYAVPYKDSTFEGGAHVGFVKSLLAT